VWGGGVSQRVKVGAQVDIRVSFLICARTPRQRFRSGGEAKAGGKKNVKSNNQRTLLYNESTHISKKTLGLMSNCPTTSLYCRLMTTKTTTTYE
jgi:hypothetical protein